jgi:choline-glycine betaine transporter
MWRKWWLLFTVIWVVIAGIQALLILLTSDEPDRALQPAILAVAVPAVLYVLGLVVERVRRKP